MLRLGLLDLCALIMLAVVLFLPGRQYRIDPLYEEAAAEDVRELAYLQGALAEDPGNGIIAAKMADKFVRMGQHHYAIRMAGETGEQNSPSAWRAWLAVSVAHGERVEMEKALAYASKALLACRDPKADCPEHEYVRLQVYDASLEAGYRSGVDPREDPGAFRQVLLKTFPQVRGGKPR